MCRLSSEQPSSCVDLIIVTFPTVLCRKIICEELSRVKTFKSFGFQLTTSTTQEAGWIHEVLTPVNDLWCWTPSYKRKCKWPWDKSGQRGILMWILKALVCNSGIVFQHEIKTSKCSKNSVEINQKTHQQILPQMPSISKWSNCSDTHWLCIQNQPPK